MSAAPGYTPVTSFANDETNGVAGRSTVKTVSLDTECANIASSINALNTNLQVIHRDDGKLRDFAVEPYALSEQTRSLVASGGNPRGMWATLTVYAVGDVVQYGTIAYLCYTAHTSTGVFDTAKIKSISGDGTAAFHASQAATSATNAAASATTATTQATNAAASASSAATQATNAATSASNASTNAGITLGHANNAATSATNAALSYDSFDDRYLGAKSDDPTVDNDGNPLLVGALYWNTTTNTFKARTSAGAWANFVVNAQPQDDQLTTLAGLSVQQATDLLGLSAYFGALLNDPDEAALLASIGLKPVSFSVHKNAVNKPLPTAAFTKVTWSTEEFDTNSNFDSTTNNRFTVTLPGKYALSASVHISITNNANSTIAAIYKNGVIYKQELVYHSPVSGRGTVTVTIPAVTAIATDYFEVFAYTSDPAGGTISGVSAETYFTGARISP